MINPWSIAIHWIKLAQRVSELERRHENMVRHGTVKEVDAKKQRVRMVIGKDLQGQDQLSPWVPYSQHAGDYKHHSPPTVGQTLTLFSPSGDFRQGFLLPLTFSDKNKSPSDKPDEHVQTYSKAGSDGQASQAQDTDYKEVRKYNERIIQVGKARIHMRPGDKDEIHFQVGDNTHIRLGTDGVFIKGGKITADGETHVAKLVADQTAPSSPWGGVGEGFPSFPGWSA